MGIYVSFWGHVETQENTSVPPGYVVKTGALLQTTKITEDIFHVCGSGLCGGRGKRRECTRGGGSKGHHPCSACSWSVTRSATHPATKTVVNMGNVERQCCTQLSFACISSSMVFLPLKKCKLLSDLWVQAKKELHILKMYFKLVIHTHVTLAFIMFWSELDSVSSLK